MDALDEKRALGRESSSASSSTSRNHAEEADPATIQKEEEIREACKWKDAGRLRSLAETRGGLLKDELRRDACTSQERVEAAFDAFGHLIYHTDFLGPILMAVDPKTNTANADWKQLPSHRDEDQVRLDVDRSFVYYPQNQSESESQRRKSELSALITEVLRRNPYLHYFQGYHDICQVLLLVLPPELRAPVVARLSVLRIRDFMLPNLNPTTAQLRLLPDILGRADPKLCRHLWGVEPFYALSGTLTMFAHNIEKYHDIARLFDIFLAREPVFSIYMFAQIVIDRRDEVLEIDEADMLHVILGKVPPSMDLDMLIADAMLLFKHYPPERLRNWKNISGASSLKTVRHVEQCAEQNLEDGREFFERQAKELRWMEVQNKVKSTMWAYRRPAGTVGAALAVGILAFYLRRNPVAVNYIWGLFVR